MVIISIKVVLKYTKNVPVVLMIFLLINPTSVKVYPVANQKSWKVKVKKIS